MQNRSQSRHLVSTVPLVGSSAAMQKLRVEISRVARARAAVLLQGESGTGKELVARLIHDESQRSGSLVVVNCPALPHASYEPVILRAVEGHSFERHGGRENGWPSFRLVAATHKMLNGLHRQES